MCSRRIFGGILLLIMLGGGFWIGARLLPSRPTMGVTPSQEEIQQSWNVGVKRVIEEYESSKNAVQAKQQLLALTVPAHAREVHLALVLALEAKIQGRDDAETRLDAARALSKSLK